MTPEDAVGIESDRCESTIESQSEKIRLFPPGIYEPILLHSSGFIFLELVHTVDFATAWADDFNDKIRWSFQIACPETPTI
jgi:hypothetical protein